MMGGGMMGRNDCDEPIVLATVNYEASGQSLSIPSKLTSITPLPEPQTVRSFELNYGMHPAVGMAFLINGEPYSSDRLDTQVQHFQSIGNYKAWNSALCSIFAITF